MGIDKKEPEEPEEPEKTKKVLKGKVIVKPEEDDKKPKEQEEIIETPKIGVVSIDKKEPEKPEEPNECNSSFSSHPKRTSGTGTAYSKHKTASSSFDFRGRRKA